MREIDVKLLIDNLISWADNPEWLQGFINNRFCLIVLVIFLMKMTRASYSSLLMCALINIPGTILHEFMHFLVGLVLNARPCNFTIIPRREGNSYVMGSVGFRNIRFYNALPSALAPLLLLPLGFYLNRYYLPTIDVTWGNYISYILLQTIIVANALPSSVDWKVAMMYKKGVVFYIVLLALFLLYHFYWFY